MLRYWFAGVCVVTGDVANFNRLELSERPVGRNFKGHTEKARSGGGPKLCMCSSVPVTARPQTNAADH